MIKKFRAIRDEIAEVEIVRETAKQVVLKAALGGTRRENKVNDYCAYFDTREEAKQYLIGKAKFNVENCEFKLRLANERLDRIKLL